MRAGKLRHLVSIQRMSTQRDAAGQQLQDWVEFASVMADIRPLRGREFLTAQQTNAEIDTEIQLRYVEGVTARDRVVHGTTVYNIKSPPVVTRQIQHEMILLCGTGLNNG